MSYAAIRPVPEAAALYTVRDPVTDQALHAFAEWSNKRAPLHRLDGGMPITPEDLVDPELYKWKCTFPQRDPCGKAYKKSLVGLENADPTTAIKSLDTTIGDLAAAMGSREESDEERVQRIAASVQESLSTLFRR